MMYVLLPYAAPGSAAALKTLEQLAPGEIEVHAYEEDKTPQEQWKLANVMIPGVSLITREMIEGAPNLKLIMQFGVGLDTVDIPAATERGVYVANVPSASAPSQAEFAITLILAMAKHLHRSLVWIKNHQMAAMLGSELTGKTLGIIGLGNSGRELAPRAKALGLRVWVVEPREVTHPDCEFIGGLDKFDYVLNNADFVSIHCTLNEKTKNLIDAAKLAQMKPTAYLINVARAGIVDRKALYDALKENRIAGAGLDVFWEEPADPSDPYFALENCLLTPHIATATAESRVRVGIQVAKDIVAVGRGGRPESCVNL